MGVDKPPLPADAAPVKDAFRSARIRTALPLRWAATGTQSVRISCTTIARERSRRWNKRPPSGSAHGGNSTERECIWPVEAKLITHKKNFTSSCTVVWHRPRVGANISTCDSPDTALVDAAGGGLIVQGSNTSQASRTTTSSSLSHWSLVMCPSACKLRSQFPSLSRTLPRFNPNAGVDCALGWHWDPFPTPVSSTTTSTMCSTSSIGRCVQRYAGTTQPNHSLSVDRLPTVADNPMS